MIKEKNTTNVSINLMIHQILKQNKNKLKYFILFTLIMISMLLVTVVLKNDEELISKGKKVSFKHSDLALIKEFLLTKIKSPFINIDYKIKSGDTIHKILKKFKIKNNEIQTVINQYKKFGNPAQLLTGNKIDIVIEDNLSGKNKSITKFSVPITKSTTIEITKDELGKIASKKIITKLYKKKVLAENIIINNLYTSAMEAKINPDTIINHFHTISIPRPSKSNYNKILPKKLPSSCNLKKISNIKNIITNTNPFLFNIDNYIENLYENINNPNSIKFLLFRDLIYDIFIYDMEIGYVIWGLIQKIVKNNNVSIEKMTDIHLNTFSFLQYYNNNYRPIYHLENYLYNLINTIHGF